MPGSLCFPRDASGKDPPVNVGDVRDLGLIPGSGRPPEREQGNPLQYSCLEDPTDRGAWRATVHGSRRVRHDWSDLACMHTASLTSTLQEPGQWHAPSCIPSALALCPAHRRCLMVMQGWNSRQNHLTQPGAHVGESPLRGQAGKERGWVRLG